MKQTAVVRIGTLTQKDTSPLYGQFIEHIIDCIDGGISNPAHPTADKFGIRGDVVEQAKKLAPTVLRFPGGTLMCQYHWMDAIGSKEDRICRQNLIWGGELDPSFGTAEFVQFCRQIGAEPMICVNMVSGTPEEAGNWVEYCNGTGKGYYAELRRKHGFEEPFNVKYWCIGNESYAEPDMGIHHDVNLYTRDAMEFVKRMKLTDRSIQTVIVGCGDPKWDKAVLDALHAVTDYFSIHNYANTGKGDAYAPYHGEMGLARTLDRVSTLIDTYPDTVTDFNYWYRFAPRNEKIKIAVDEWNIWDCKEDGIYGLHQVYNWRDALWVACMLNRFIATPSVGMANMAQLVNVIAPIRTEKDGVWLQTIAYPLIAYRKYLTGAAVTVNVESPLLDCDGAFPVVSASAAETDGGLCVALVNRDVDNDCLVRVETADGKQPVRMTVLTGDSWQSVCGPDTCCVHTNETAVTSNDILCPKGSICLLHY